MSSNMTAQRRPAPTPRTTRFIAEHVPIHLPDAPGDAAVRIRLRPAPLREPPFDDEFNAPRIFCRGDQQLPFGPHISDVDSGTISGGVAVRDSELVNEMLGDPGSFGRSLLTGCFEVIHGRRAPVQLVQMVSRSVFTGLARDLNNPSFVKRWPSKTSVRSVRHFIPADGVAEVSAVIQTNGRVRAAALRLEAQHGQWRCVKLQLG